MFNFYCLAVSKNLKSAAQNVKSWSLYRCEVSELLRLDVLLFSVCFNSNPSWSRCCGLKPERVTWIQPSPAPWLSRTWICAAGWTRNRPPTSANSPPTRRASRGRRSSCRSFRPRYGAMGLLQRRDEALLFSGDRFFFSAAASGAAVQKEMWGSGADAAGEICPTGEAKRGCRWLLI